MKIAIIGSGISGMVAAYLLHPLHPITVFEADPRIGGHSHTHWVKRPDATYPVDLGFIVYNTKTYPNFTRLVKQLQVSTQKSDMSFGFRDGASGLEFATHGLGAWFARKREVFKNNLYPILWDAWRFSKQAPHLAELSDKNFTLKKFFKQQHYSQKFCEHFLIPMAASIWSTDPEKILDFPAPYLARFFVNHRMHAYFRQPQWRTITGGSQKYVEALTQNYCSQIHRATPIESIQRNSHQVKIRTAQGVEINFDRVVLATHSNQALKILSDATAPEREILSAMGYQKNNGVLHHDHGLLPRRKRAWASWNYHRFHQENKRVALTYDLSRLQSITSPERFLVTLNSQKLIKSQKILFERDFEHPQYSPQAFAAQSRFAEINGKNNTYFCGAYWRWGFHEDGVVSAIQTVASMGERERKRVEEVFGK